MDKDIFSRYQSYQHYRHFKRALNQARRSPNAALIFTAVDAYDQLCRHLDHSARQQLDQLIRHQLPREWRLWRRCADSYRRWPEVFSRR